MFKKSLLLVIILMVVGFAAVSTTLYLNGETNIAANVDDFEVYFSSAKIDGAELSNEIISTDGRSIEFKTNDLAFINEKSKSS